MGYFRAPFVRPLTTPEPAVRRRLEADMDVAEHTKTGVVGNRRGASETAGLHAARTAPGRALATASRERERKPLSRGTNVASVRTVAVTAFTTAWLSGYGFFYLGH